MSLAGLPASTPVYIDGFGPSTIGEIRATEETPALDEEWAATLDMWGDVCTRNLCREPWEPGATPSEVRAYHVSRYLSGQMPRAST